MSRAPLTEETRRFLRRFGDVVRTLRRDAGLLQEQLAARMETVGARVGEIERGEVDTSLSRARTIAVALGLPLSGLLRRVELAADPVAVDQLRDRLRDAIRKLAPADLELLATLVRRLLA